ncbi:MAG: hypothetical protein HY064_02615 [Bacteroidetes bacterium]|nr:hypothetical protein [Bacteroidota bacterium]
MNAVIHHDTDYADLEMKVANANAHPFTEQMLLKKMNVSGRNESVDFSLFDREGRLVSSSSGGPNRSGIKYYFNDRGCLTEYDHLRKDRADFIIRYDYNDTQCVQITNILTDGNYTTVATVEHDNAGRRSRKIENDGITTYTYTPHGDLSSQVKLNADSSQRHEILFFYNKKNWLVMEEEWFETDTMDIYFFRYDSLGRLTNKINYKEFDPVDKPLIEESWEYNKDGLPSVYHYSSRFMAENINDYTKWSRKYSYSYYH